MHPKSSMIADLSAFKFWVMWFRAGISCSFPSCHVSTYPYCMKLLLNRVLQVLLGYGAEMLLDKGLWDEPWTLSQRRDDSSSPGLFGNMRVRPSWNSCICWQAYTNQDQRIGFKIGPVSQALRLFSCQDAFPFLALFHFTALPSRSSPPDLLSPFSFPSIVAVSPLPPSCH